MTRAALKVQRVYRRRTARINGLATRIQTYYRGYLGKMRARRERKFQRINDGRKRRIARLNTLMKLLGQRSYTHRIKRFEWYESIGLLAADPWHAYETKVHSEQTAYEDWIKLKTWTLREGSRRDRYLLRVQQRWRSRRRRMKLWWEMHVKRKLHPRDYVDLAPIKTAMPNKVCSTTQWVVADACVDAQSMRCLCVCVCGGGGGGGGGGGVGYVSRQSVRCSLSLARKNGSWWHLDAGGCLSNTPQLNAFNVCSVGSANDFFSNGSVANDSFVSKIGNSCVVLR